ncbi:leucyl aminopeptidase [Thermoflexibacter ruber]|uniref:Probable cytosol aminopeptidase n=1 Tax=Thermoflexibacter ruber TaxID=1003 RepID=A0A1I2BP54_9BACT|nr:leucyl aminopeptidase [Thermoflexibacter ruber]SFE57881.1 leucyl aminopeptidase [Thermoflexibacter ruber]
MNFQVIEKADKKHTLIIPLTTKDLVLNLESLTTNFGLPSAVAQDFKASNEETLLIYGSQAGLSEKILLLGLGDNFKTETLRNAIRLVFHKQKEKLGEEVIIHLDYVVEKAVEQEVATAVEACANGAELATYQIAKFKQEEKPAKFPQNVSFVFPTHLNSLTQQAIKRGVILASTQQKVFDLVNLPPNILNSLKLAEFAEEAGKAYNFSVKVLHLEEIKAIGLGGLLAINQGSDTPPTFIIMEYKPEKQTTKKVGLVGKGVTFDTGGISIKPSEGMWQMKCDMAGAAAVIGAVEAAARLALPVHVIGVVPATDNMLSGKAIYPGSIIKTYSGLSVEIEDTDAEGRVILADGLAYIKKNFEPDVIIDLATLTGACVVALGYHAAGMFTNNDELAIQLSKIGEQTGEKVWRLPLWEEYDKQIKSDMADVKNLGGRPAGAVTAAKFLEKFIDKHPAWVHLDIAGVAFTDNPYSSARSATGYGVRLLTNFLSQF